MQIREYTSADEQGWVRCRVVSFLDCSYFNDVKTEKETYEQPSFCLVAEEQNQIVGLIDVEVNSNDLSCNNGEPGAIVWNMAVLPEYRKKKVATKLWERAKEYLLREKIHYCELWTQEDVAANQFYRSLGFQLEESQTWLRCYARGKKNLALLNQEAIGKMYGLEELIFCVPVERKEEMRDRCYRMDEVRLYSIRY